MSKKDIAKLVAAEAALVEREHEAGVARTYVRPLPPREPSQVYSIRIPIDQIEALRHLARERHQLPSTMLRDWILERLAHETSPVSAVRRSGNAALTVVDIIDSSLSTENLGRVTGYIGLRSHTGTPLERVLLWPSPTGLEGF